MNGDKPNDTNADAFDVSLDRAPSAPVIEVQEDDGAKRRREAALASTFDPERAHDGKTDEEMIEERAQETRILVDVAIVAGIAVAVIEADATDDFDLDLEGTATSDDDGE